MISIGENSKIRHLGGFQLQLQFVRNEGDEFRIRRLTLRIGNCVSKEALESIQISTIPSYFNGVADGAFHPTGGGLEGFATWG